METLKPCPFCGRVDITLSGDPTDGTYYYVCIGCGTSQFSGSYEYKTPAAAAAAWNRRALPSGEQAKVEWLDNNCTVKTRTGSLYCDVYRTGGEGASWVFRVWVAYMRSSSLLFFCDGFPTAESARAECERRLSLLLEATKTEVG